MDETNQNYDNDAVVVGGDSVEALPCISAASHNVKLEPLPEVNELTKLVTNHAAPAEKTADDKRAPIRVSIKSAQTADKAKQPRPIKKIIAASLLAVAFVALAVGIYATYSMMSIVNSVNYQHGSLSFDKVDVLVSQSETVQ